LNRLAAIVVVLLIGGTAAAFAYTQGLKQTKSPIVATKVTKQFSRFAHIAFGLRRDDHLSIEILNSRGDVVRTLVADRAVRKGYRGFTWDGRGDGGQRLPDGVYKARIDLQDADRTIDLPNRILLDTVPPRVTGASSRVTASLLRVRYRFDEQAHALLFVNGRRRLKSASYKPSGRVDLPLRDVPKGAVVALAAEDLAGNLSKLRVLKLSRPR
jgi:hypothetical protein